jgi:hypothetical protein
LRTCHPCNLSLQVVLRKRCETILVSTVGNIHRFSSYLWRLCGVGTRGGCTRMTAESTSKATAEHDTANARPSPAVRLRRNSSSPRSIM